MTTNSTTSEDRLAKLGIHLPDAPTPFGAYVPAVQTGHLLFLSGMLATLGHTARRVRRRDAGVHGAPESRRRGVGAASRCLRRRDGLFAPCLWCREPAT